MTPRPSLRSVGTTLAAAAVLVVGANLASYAATGNALILGHANKAGGTTSLKNTGRGPALSLNSIKSAPPLVVNSSKLVKHLNASMVGGANAALAAPTNYQITFAGAGSTFSGERIVTAKVPAGTYQVTLNGAIVPDATTSVQCFFGDARFLSSSNPAAAIGFVYAATYDAAATTGGFTVNAVGVAKVGRGRTLFEACFGSAGTNTVLLPLEANLTRVNGVTPVKKKVVPPARAGVARSLLGR
jgi:hypothetical protein